MAIHRTYIVEMPGTSFSGTPLDIVVAYPGSNSAPIAYPAAGGTAQTAPPTGWAAGDTAFDGAYYEWRGRPLDIPVLSTAGGSLASGITNGFVPRARLGFTLSITNILTSGVAVLPVVQLSRSLVGSLQDSAGVLNVAALSDPAYGPVIRLNTDNASAGLIYVVNFSIYEAKDEDRDPTGSV